MKVIGHFGYWPSMKVMGHFGYWPSMKVIGVGGALAISASFSLPSGGIPQSHTFVLYACDILLYKFPCSCQCVHQSAS
jgi:hypothetical protein